MTKVYQKVIKKQNKTNIYMTVADHGGEPKSHHIGRN
jgi:hypothetical protein